MTYDIKQLNVGLYVRSIAVYRIMSYCIAYLYYRRNIATSVDLLLCLSRVQIWRQSKRLVNHGLKRLKEIAAELMIPEQLRTLLEHGGQVSTVPSPYVSATHASRRIPRCRCIFGVTLRYCQYIGSYCASPRSILYTASKEESDGDRPPRRQAS